MRNENSRNEEYEPILNIDDIEINNVDDYNFQNGVDEIKDKYAIVFGEIQVGKSTFINCITKSKVCEVGKGFKSCTLKPTYAMINKDGFNFYFVDTPGLNDGDGDEENIKKLESLKKKVRPCTIILCLVYQHPAITGSFKKSLIEFMKIYPSEKFWNHVLIVFTHSEPNKKTSENLQKFKNNFCDFFLKEIQEDNDLCDFMNEKGIKMPDSSQIKIFFVEVNDDFSPDDYTQNEFRKILNAMKDNYPIYKYMEEKRSDDSEEFEKDGCKFIKINTVKTITFTDFDNTKHTTPQIKLSEEIYPIGEALIGKKPKDIIIIRKQSDKPRSKFWPCCKNQYRTKYFEIAKYEKDNGEIITVKAFLESSWENKNEIAEKEGNEKCQNLRNKRKIKYYKI